MDDAYRGSKSALSARVAAIEEEIRQAEAQLSRDFWERAAPELELTPPESFDGAEPSSMLLEERKQRLEAIRSVLQDLDAIEERWAEPADTVAPTGAAQETNVLSLFGRQTLDADEAGRLGIVLGTEMWAEVLRHLHRHSAGLVLPERGRGRWGNQFTVDEIPIDVQVALLRRRSSGDNNYHEVALATSVAPAAGPLRLEPEGFFQDILELLGLSREIEIGDPNFDPVFIIRGHEPSARELLNPKVRADLLVMSAQTGVRLFIDQGRAILRFAATMSGTGIDAAIRVLLALHRAPPPRSVRATPD